MLIRTVVLLSLQHKLKQKYASAKNHTSVKGSSTNRFRPPIADLLREVVNPPPPPHHRGPTYESVNCVIKMPC